MNAKPKQRRKPRHTIEVYWRKLGREKALGLAYKGTRIIELDPRARSRSLMNTAIHEATHLLYPDASEAKVIRVASAITSLLWRIGCRIVRD